MAVGLRPDLKNLGRRLRQARSNARMTQSQLGRHLDVTKQLVSHWETGRCDITRERLVVLARLLRVDVEWLAQGTILEQPGVAGISGTGPHALDGLAQLGQKVSFPRSPELALLERVPNPHHDTHYVARFTAPEFTALCPVTGQPDFAHLVIDYVPDRWLIESKSLKLYLASFRNHGAFHEDCTVTIGKRLAELLAAHFLRIGGYWYPRGGIPIDVFWQSGALPAGVWLPDQGVAPYRGRG